jgi:NAD(P)H-dependent flavin oxidoreductase YrpB (nitropropane dioxygenase family)
MLSNRIPGKIAKRLRLPLICSHDARGGISDGHALWAAEVVGCDLAYVGTKFIATHESMAPSAYNQVLVESSMQAVVGE